MPEIENKNYRDTVFRMLFNNKKELLSLYNALNGTACSNEDDLYLNKLIKIPAPRFFVFYNGTVPMEDRKIYRLSEQFEKSVEEPELELTVTALNINHGHNQELMKACNALKEYSLFASIV